jgi:ABC-type Na+ efflux pump permease subunit
MSWNRHVQRSYQVVRFYETLPPWVLVVKILVATNQHNNNSNGTSATITTNSTATTTTTTSTSSTSMTTSGGTNVHNNPMSDLVIVLFMPMMLCVILSTRGLEGRVYDFESIKTGLEHMHN